MIVPFEQNVLLEVLRREPALMCPCSSTLSTPTSHPLFEPLLPHHFTVWEIASRNMQTEGQARTQIAGAEHTPTNTDTDARAFTERQTGRQNTSARHTPDS
jgi:hypothetical protein